jgi:hypothetical protein
VATDPRAKKILDEIERGDGGASAFYDGYDAPDVEETTPQTLPAGVSLIWTPKQVAWWEAVVSELYGFMALGGAIRGTKTFTVLMTVFMLMKRYPRSRHIVVRKDLPVIRRNIVPPIEKLRAKTGSDFRVGDLNMTSWEYTAANGAKLLLVPESIKDDPELEKFHGLEANTITLEESNELTVAMKNKAIERAGSWIIPEDREQSVAINRALQMGWDQQKAIRQFGAKQCPPFNFYTFNPADNWVREDIYDPYEKGELEPPWFFMPVTIYDNPFVTDAYLKNLEELRKVDPDHYDRFVLGKWGDIRVENQLIDPRWLKAAREVPARPGERRLGVDVARYGKDSTVFADVDGNTLTAVQEERLVDTAVTATIVTRRHRERSVPARNITVDTNGLGGGVADMARTNGVAVNEFVMGERPVRRVIGHRPLGQYLVGQRSFYRFKNVWSQAAWEAREKFRKGDVRLAAKHHNLVRHLTSFRYEITNREIGVWSSDKVREELGFSPDVGVAVILALFEFPDRSARRGVPSVVVRRGSQPDARYGAGYDAMRGTRAR